MVTSRAVAAAIQRNILVNAFGRWVRQCLFNGWCLPRLGGFVLYLGECVQVQTENGKEKNNWVDDEKGFTSGQVGGEHLENGGHRVEEAKGKGDEQLFVQLHGISEETEHLEDGNPNTGNSQTVAKETEKLVD